MTCPAGRRVLVMLKTTGPASSCKGSRLTQNTREGCRPRAAIGRNSTQRLRSFARLCGARALGAISAPCRASTLLDTASQLRAAHTAWRSQATREWPSEYRPRRCCPCCSSMSLVLRCKPMGVAGRDATAMWQTQIPRCVHVADARPCDMHTPPHWEEAGWHLGRVSYTTTSDHAVAQSSIVYRGNVSRARPVRDSPVCVRSAYDLTPRLLQNRILMCFTLFSCSLTR